MCACKQKKSFLIEDILNDTRKKPYKNLSNEPTKPLLCKSTEKSNSNTQRNVPEKPDVNNPKDYSKTVVDSSYVREEKIMRFNVISEVQNEIELSKVNLEHRRNTYPIYPTPVKPNFPWNYRKESMGYVEPRMGFYSEQMLNTSHILRNQLAANRFVTHPFAMRQPYGFDRGPNCCSPWWGLGGRRKGGQVRFTGTQTAALERRFSASKYLSPDERRALATTLRLSDRQVKTWFQNRRAKWRRTTPDSADVASPATSADSDDEVQIADDS